LTETTQSTTQTTQSTQLTDQDKQVLRMIAAEPSITQLKLSLEIVWSVDRVKYYIKKLRGKDILRRNGTTFHATKLRPPLFKQVRSFAGCIH